MSISAMIAIVISVIFVALLISAFTGVFQNSTDTAMSMLS